MHHYAFTSDNYTAFYDAAANDQRSAVNHPQSCLVVMGGDFDVMRDDSLRFNVARPARVPLPSRSESVSDSDSRLKRFLGSLVGIVQNRPTCFHSPSKTESTIDRFFVFSPSWIMRQLHARSFVSSHPSKLYLDHVSDHSPVMLVLSPVGVQQKQHRSIPSWITKSPLFKKSIKDGLIHPEMLQREAVRLRKKCDWELDQEDKTPFKRKRGSKLQIYNEDCIVGCRKRIESNSIDLIINDPPFGIGEDDIGNRYARCESNVIPGYVEVPPSKYEEFTTEFMKEVERTLKPGGSAYIFSGFQNLRHILNAGSRTGLVERNHIIWKYDFGLYTTKRYVSCHYHLLYFIKKPISKVVFNEFGDVDGQGQYKDREDVWYIEREYKSPDKIKNQNELPMSLVEKIVRYSSNPGDKVMDMFMGGFTTAKVSIKLGREPLGFEINKEAFDYFYPLLK